MAALTADRNTKKADGKFVSFPVAASTKIYAGGGVCINVDGYAVPAGDVANYKSVGIAQESVDNSSGADGDINVIVDTKSVFEMYYQGVNQGALMFDTFWLSDNQVGGDQDPVYSIKAGKIVKVDTNSVWVDPTM